MKQDVMSCSAVEPKCPCYAAMEVKEAFMGNPQFKETNYYGAESFSAETSRFNEKLWRKEYTTEGDFVDLMEIKKGTGRGLVLLRNRNGIVDGPSYWDSSPPAIEWIEDILGNSDWELIIADQLGALSEAPVLAKGHYDDEGNFVLNSNVAYYFGNYQIEDWGEVLDREGEVFFHRASFSKAAESHGYSYAYNDGHSDARKRDEYRPNLSSTKQESDFKKILKQKAEFSDEDWDGPFTKELRVRIDSVGGQFAPDWANEMEIEVQYHDESDLYAITDSITDAIKKTVNNNNESLFGAEQKTFEMQPIDKEMMKKFREFRKQMRELPQAEKDKRRKLAMKDREDYLKRKGAESFSADDYDDDDYENAGWVKTDDSFYRVCKTCSKEFTEGGSGMICENCMRSAESFSAEKGYRNYGGERWDKITRILVSDEKEDLGNGMNRTQSLKNIPTTSEVKKWLRVKRTKEYPGNSNHEYYYYWGIRNPEYGKARKGAEYSRDSDGRFTSKSVFSLTTAAIIGLAGAYFWRNKK